MPPWPGIKPAKGAWGGIGGQEMVHPILLQRIASPAKVRRYSERQEAVLDNEFALRRFGHTEIPAGAYMNDREVESIEPRPILQLRVDRNQPSAQQDATDVLRRQRDDRGLRPRLPPFPDQARKYLRSG